MNLANQPVRKYTKEMQLFRKPVKPTQKQKGDISTKVDRELKERSGGVCELRRTCHGNKAVERSHTMGRRIIPHKTTVDDLFHACKLCHIWLDETPDGIRFRKRVREIGTTAYLGQRNARR